MDGTKKATGTIPSPLQNEVKKEKTAHIKKLGDWIGNHSLWGFLYNLDEKTCRSLIAR